MIDMIRKHTVEGTGNHKTIVECLERADTMLKDTKAATRSFVHDPNDRNHVPLGSASDSMYVGYSPADHEYGEAANRYGQQMAQARKAGAEPATGENGTEYKGGKKFTAQASSKYSSGANGVPVAPRKGPEPAEPVQEKEVMTSEKVTAQAPEIEANPIFFMDTPTATSETTAQSSKRGQADSSERPSKKSKLRQVEPEGEKEDISAEVDARLAEKEKKRKDKKANKGNKRKRESDDSAQPEEETNEDKMDVDDAEEKTEKPKKKKTKKILDEVEDGAAEAAEEAKTEKSKKKAKKSKETSEDKKRALEADAEHNFKAKKSKKSKTERAAEA